MAQVAVIARLTAAQGRSEELAAVIDDLVTSVGSDEPDTVVYAAHQDSADADVFWFYELYDSPDAAAAHAAGPVLAEAGRRMRGLLAAPPEVHRLTPLRSTGLTG